MDLLRRFISFVNRNGEPIENCEDLSIPVCYFGHTYVAQPTSDELRRASFILETRNKRVSRKNTISMLTCVDDGPILLQDSSNGTVTEFDVKKIVVSCVDAKNQRLLAIFYDYESPYSCNGMQCHLFLCRNKMVARVMATKIGDKLSEAFQTTEKLPPKIKLDQVRISRPNVVSDFDYENISKFFREQVLNQPSSESSSTYLTVGCDSGRASTVASVDTRSEEVSGAIRNPIHEFDESEPEVNFIDYGGINLYVTDHEDGDTTEASTLESTSFNKKNLANRNDSITIFNPSIKPITLNRYSEQYEIMETNSNQTDRSECNKSDDTLLRDSYYNQYELMDSNEKTAVDIPNEIEECKYSENVKNRYSVHYDQQDELLFDEGDKKEAVLSDIDDDAGTISSTDLKFGVSDIEECELHRLTYLEETNI